jgi:tetratricopeptide (TPR) repeat protein
MLASLLRRIARRAASSSPAGHPLDGIRAALRADRYEEALRALDALPSGGVVEADRHALRAECLAQLGEEGRALDAIRRAAELGPGRATLQLGAARACFDRGLWDEAKRHCRRALAVDPDIPPAHQMLAAIELPGESYLAVLARIHAHLAPRTYVEIGVSEGDSIRLGHASTKVVGIDPEARLAGPLGPDHRVFRQTSDAFFAAYDLRALFDGLPVDLAFIDGMHHFEFALRDFVNLERYCSRESTILVHDCYPLDAETAARERATAFWSGDVWRLVLALKKHRPDLSIHTVAAPPTGLAMIRNLDPTSRVLADDLERICDEFLAVEFEAIAERKAERLNLFPNDWERVKELLGGARHAAPA